jgi:hypothetical protein
MSTQLEIMGEQELVAVAEQNALTAPASEQLLNAFAPMAKQARSLVAQSHGVTDPKLARACRLKLRETRIEIENTRKRLKEDSLRTGKAIDGMANILKYVIEPVEEQLEAHEKAAERVEAARIESIRRDRHEQLAAVGVNGTFYNLGALPDDAFAQLLDASKAVHAAKIEAARKVEEERAAKEAAEAAERERIRLENERLKKEAAEREAALQAERARVAAEQAAAAEKARKERELVEAKAKAEREEIERKMQAERAARVKAEQEAAAAKKAQEDRDRAEADARRKSAMAPDRNKILALGETIRATAIPEVASKEAQSAVREIKARIWSLANEIEKMANAVGGEGLNNQ